jgi:hypothetical protein
VRGVAAIAGRDRPPPRANEVKNTVQLADAPLPANVHGLPKKLPAALLVKLTVPVGVLCPLPAASVTVALQAAASPGANTLGEQLTLANVGSLVGAGNGPTASPLAAPPVAMVAGVMSDNAPVEGSTLYCETAPTP